MTIKPGAMLVIRPDRLGDVLLTLPLVESLRAYYPESRIDFLCQSYTEKLLKFYPAVNNLVIFDHYKKSVRFHAIKQLVTELKKNKYDLAIHVLPRFETALAVYLAGVRFSLGSGFRWFSFLFNLRHYEHRKKNIFHEAECNLRLLNKLDIPWEIKSWKEVPFKFDRDDYQAVNYFLQENDLKPHNYLILHPGSGGSTRTWPLAYYRDLLRLITNQLDYKVALTGSENEKQRFMDAGQDKLPPFIDCFGRFSLPQLAIFLSQAVLFVSNSTGPLHLAVTMGIPVLGFYPEITAMNPMRWGPFQRTKQQTLTPKNIRSDYSDQMETIKPEIALNRIKAILDIN